LVTSKKKEKGRRIYKKGDLGLYLGQFTDLEKGEGGNNLGAKTPVNMWRVEGMEGL